MSDARLLVEVLREPERVLTLDGAGWTALIAMARAEQLIGSLAYRLEGLPLPATAARIMSDARALAEEGRRAALWEAEMARRVLAPTGVPIVLLKGTAYVAAGLAAGVGRAIGDLDILVPRDGLDAVEAALLAHGWDWAKPDPYDDLYYRRWMHELPPLVHRDRDRIIDVHHTILPLTARPTPDAAAMIADRVMLENGLAVLSPVDMICHSAAHLFADGDLAGGLRNLWDIHRLCSEFMDREQDFCLAVYERAWEQGLWTAVTRGLRISRHLFGTAVVGYRNPIEVSLDLGRLDALFIRRLLARDGWGRETQPVTRLGFYVRSHAIRMPPAMLARHLFTKWRRRSGAGASTVAEARP